MNLKERASGVINILPLLIAIWVILLIPFKIIGYGYMPPDDALRHSAKVISAKDWNQIVVLRDEIKMDSHPGWHAILGFVHRTMGWDTHSLVLFSVVSLFVLFLLLPLAFLKYPESWLLTLSTITLFSFGWIFRLFLGRPYIFTMVVLMAICFMWPSLKNKKTPIGTVILLTLAIALSTWIHCSWYLFILPIIAFFLAREWRAGIIFSGCVVLGVAIGSIWTGHPIMFLRQIIAHFCLAFQDMDQSVLVTEFRPGTVDPVFIIIVIALLGWRALRGKWDRRVVDNPVFILAGLCSILGFLAIRVFADWAMPAMIVWIAMEFDEFLKERAIRPIGRVVLVLAAALVVYLSFTADAGGRWSRFKPIDYLVYEDPDQKAWLPEPGGIVYSDDMYVFYSTFYKNPKADWRYILGFEPGLMPKEDLDILRNIQKNFRLYNYFQPWVKKMRPEDRLILRGSPNDKPKISELEWYYAAAGTWSGRLPRSASAPK